MVGGSGEGYPGVLVALRRGNASHSLQVVERSSSGIVHRKQLVNIVVKFLAVLTLRHAVEPLVHQTEPRFGDIRARC